MTSQSIQLPNIIIIRESLSHYSNQEVQKMNHKEENSGNPKDVQHCLLSSISNTICTNIKLSQSDLPHMWHTAHHSVICNLSQDVFSCCGGVDVKFQLILSYLVETDRKWQHKHHENDNEPEDVY